MKLLKTHDLNLAKLQINVDHRDNGSIILENKIELDARDETLIDVLETSVSENPDADYLKERDGAGWRSISYADFLAAVQRRAGQILTHSNASQQRPMLILAPNSIEHAITSFAAMYAGIPVSSVSPAYGLMAGALPRLEKVVSVLKPGAIFIGEPNAYQSALPFLQRSCPDNVFSHAATDDVRSIYDLPLGEARPLEVARTSLKPSSVAKILFTSGSTGAPKGVMTTHRMVCSNQRSLAQLWPFLTEKPPILVDWMPWSHVFGGNVCAYAALFHGGTLHIDAGKPIPGLFDKTVENLMLVPPSIQFNVPAAYEALLAQFKSDPDFAKRYFSRLDAMFVAAAALPQSVRDRLQDVARQVTGHDAVFLSGWGSTETAPFATAVYYQTDRSENIGVPMPGTQIKLSPDQDKFALMVKGPNVTPGYWNDETATQRAFDGEGFYKMGDAGKFIDPDKPELGICFDGRLSENFKLRSGTWVNVGVLRVAVLGRLQPVISDAVVTGLNSEDIGLLLVPNLQTAKERYELSEAPTPESLFALEGFREDLRASIAAHNRENPGSSTAIRRLALLTRPPDIARAEVTDKGYINQRAMLESWNELIGVLHQDGPSTDDEFLALRLKKT